MTTTVQELIEKGACRITRKLWIKRRDPVTFALEADWVRIDRDADDNSDRVMNWGQCDVGIDFTPTQIGQFTISNLNLMVNNIDAAFNAQSNTQSLWYGYSIRKWTKIKVTVCYLDTDDTEIGEASVYEGIISKVTLNTDYTASIATFSNQYLLEKYNFAQVQGTLITGTMTASAIIAAVIGDTTYLDIGKYLTLGENTQAVNVSFNNTESNTTFSGTIWSVLSEIAKLCGSVIYIINDTIYFKKREIGASLAYSFRGVGTLNPNIIKINNYEDEGAESIRLYWVDSNDPSTYAIEPPGNYRDRYISIAESINLSVVPTSGERQDILDYYLATWRGVKPTMEFTTKFLVNLVNPTDKISIQINTTPYPGTGIGYWGSVNWGDGTVYANKIGPFSESSGDDWMITKVTKDIQNLITIITAEKQ